MTSTAIKTLHSEMPGASVLSGTAGALLGVLRECLVTGRGLVSATITVAGGVATAAIAGGHVFTAGAVALVAGATPAGLNGEKRLISTGTGFVTFDATGIANGSATGSITIKLASAGWDEVYTGTNKAVFRSQNMSGTRCLLRVDDSGAKVARIRGYGAMTDVDTGTDPFPTESQQAGGLYVSKSSSADSAARPWIICASDRGVLILSAFYSGYADYSPTWFGDFPSEKAGDAWSCLICADVTDSTSYNYVGDKNALVWADSSAGAYIARPYPQVGGAVVASLRKPGLPGTTSGQSNFPPGPNPINNAMDVCPTIIYEGNTQAAPRRGVLPAIYGIPHACGSAFDSKSITAGAVGLAGHDLMGVRYTTASLAVGYRYFVDVTGPWH